MNKSQVTKAIEELLAKLGPLVDSIQEEIDELEDKQSERETDARQDKIDAIGEIHDLLEGAQNSMEEAIAQIGSL